MSSSPKIAVVTGGNKGIGYAIVKGLCEKFEGKVYLTARDVKRGEEAIAKLKLLGLKPSFHQLDINDQSSIDNFKNYIQSTYGGLDLLINNAALAFRNEDPETFGEQVENTVGVNYFGTLKVCETLFPLLRNNAKVVNLSSLLGHLSQVPSSELKKKLSDPNLTIPGLSKLMEDFVKYTKEHKTTEWGNSVFYPYIVSKAGVCALTIIQQKIFDKEQPNRNISVNSVHPGYVDTDLTEHKGHLTIEEGAKSTLFLALQANLKGKYVWSDNRVVDWYADSTPKM